MSMKTLVCGLSCAAACVAAASVARADMISYQEGSSPTSSYVMQEATVRTDQPDTPFNNSTYDYAGVLASGDVLRTIMSIPLMGIPTNAVVSDVSVAMRYESDSSSVSGYYDFALHSLSGSFDETTATWNNTFGDGTLTMGGAALAEFDSLDPTTHGTRTFTDDSGFVSYVQDAVSRGLPLNMVLALDSNVVNEQVRGTFDSDEHTTGKNATPLKLTVTYTVPAPEPTSLGLLSAGALILFRRRRRFC